MYTTPLGCCLLVSLLGDPDELVVVGVHQSGLGNPESQRRKKPTTPQKKNKKKKIDQSWSETNEMMS
jgi:hypothetical protein